MGQLPSVTRRLAAAIGRGAGAGLIGTAAMTVSSTIEARLRGRGASSAPAQAASKVLRLNITDEGTERRVSTLVHWGYGTSWGVMRGLLDHLGLGGARASALHFGIVWGSELVMLPVLQVARPPWKWGGQALAIDALHHAAYASACGVAYEMLT